jgi:hypothetical protein
MPPGRLTALQEKVLVLLAPLPAWTLTGGAALVGFYTFHRTTRDLDLFFRPRSTLDSVTSDVSRALIDAGLQVATLRSTPTFAQLEVRDVDERIVVDLVADPIPVIEEPVQVSVGGAEVHVETRYQLLVNKLCSLLSRSELRDLTDIQALLSAGADLDRDLADCPKHDGGFSPLTFSWILKDLAIARLGRAKGWSAEEIAALEVFRDELLEKLIAMTRP